VPWPKLRIGTRPSRLARVQVEMVRAALCRQVPDLQDNIEVVVFDTPGDRDRSSSLEDLGGRGVFTDNLDACVASGEIDCVVHAMKDMAPTMQSNLVIGATLQREDPREVLVAPGHKSFDALPTGAVFGSSSIRRRALLRRLRPDFQFSLLRGNVEERIAQIENGHCDGTILAYAGLARLGLLNHVQEIFPLDVLPPDPAQGAIGIVCHSDNFIARRALQLINHARTTAEVTAERALLKSLPQPDALALGAIARANGNRLELSALLVSEDGTQEWSGLVTGLVDEADALGARLGGELREPAQRLLSA
jgi:hydroxymethylbilane synthase